MEVAAPLSPHIFLMNRSNTLDVSEALREKAKGNIAQYRFMVQDIASGARLIGWLSYVSSIRSEKFSIRVGVRIRRSGISGNRPLEAGPRNFEDFPRLLYLASTAFPNVLF
jgi:hypothetical protein